MRNLVRPLVFVTTTGHILHIAQPYLARNNDANSLRHFLGTLDGEEFRKLLGNNGVILADRGFRDVSDFLTSLGIISVLPAFIPPGSKTIGVSESNKTRRLTKVRSAVERAIGRLKQFRLFRGTISISALPQVSRDFQVIAAILNRFRPPLTTDSTRDALWAEQMLLRMSLQNDLKRRIDSGEVFSRSKTHSRKLTEIGDINFPKLTSQDVRDLCFGAYQVDEGKHYIEDQLQKGDSYVFYAKLNEPGLLQVSIRSRHRSEKVWKVFVKFAPESQVYFANIFNVSIPIVNSASSQVPSEAISQSGQTTTVPETIHLDQNPHDHSALPVFGSMRHVSSPFQFISTQQSASKCNQDRPYGAQTALQRGQTSPPAANAVHTYSTSQKTTFLGDLSVIAPSSSPLPTTSPLFGNSERSESENEYIHGAEQHSEAEESPEQVTVSTKTV